MDLQITRADSSRERNVHLAGAAAAGVLALTRKRGSPWRLALAGLAGAEAWRGFSIWSLERDRAEAVPELVRSAAVNGILMRWEEHGSHNTEAPPVVMVHGLPTNPRAWRFVTPYLTKRGYRCLAWEQVGFGWSLEQGLGRDISMPKQAEYFYSWLRHLQIDRAVLVGHDFGGGVLQHFVLAHPEMCAGLVLTDSVAYDNWPVPAVRAARASREAIRLLPPMLIRPILVAALLNLGHSDTSRTMNSVQVHCLPYNRPIGPRAFAHQLAHFRTEDTMAVAGQLQGLRLPAACVLWGEHDPLGLASAKRLAAELNSELRVIAGGRHFTIEDQPEPVADAILHVLAAVRSEPTPVYSDGE